MIYFWLIAALIVILSAFVVALAVAIVRTVRMKPTAPASAQFPDCSLERAQAYAETLSTMVKCETISYADQTDRKKFDAFHKILRKAFPTLHRKAELVDLDGSLLFKIPGTQPDATQPILLMSHHDVVAAAGEWEHEPFSGDIAEGAVWGRGTVDTKGSLFCFLQATEELLKANWAPECDVYLASSCTEEWGGDGAPKTVAYLKEKGVHLGMMLDEGGMIMDSPMAGVRGRYGVVGVVEKGYADVKFTARSGGGHASSPGKNTALVRLAKLICQVEKHSPFRARFTPTLREMFRRMAPNMNFGMRLLLGNLWLFEPLLTLLLPKINPLAAAMMRTTCAFTMAQGSEGRNVLPQEAYVTANMRCMPHQPTGESLELVTKLAKRFGLETEVLYQNEPPTPVDFTSEPFKLLETTMEKIYPGYGLSPYIMTGCTDCRFYTDVTDHALRFAPLEINKQQFASVHGLNENLSVMALPPAVDFYSEILQAWAGRPAEKKSARRVPGKKDKSAADETEAVPAQQAFAEELAVLTDPVVQADPAAVQEATAPAPTQEMAEPVASALPEVQNAMAFSTAAPELDGFSEPEAAVAPIAASDPAPLSQAPAKPAAKKPAAKKPAAKKPAVKKPAVKKPAVKKPAVKKPAAKKEDETAKKPTAKKPAAKKAPAKKAAAPVEPEATAQPEVQQEPATV